MTRLRNIELASKLQCTVALFKQVRATVVKSLRD
jgi:hypothetical protein